MGKWPFTASASLWDSASALGSQVSLPPKDPQCSAVFSCHLAFDWAGASFLPGINIHNKQWAINLTTWNLLCTLLYSKLASAGCLFFMVDALHLTASKHLNLKHTIVQGSCSPCPFLSPQSLANCRAMSSMPRLREGVPYCWPMVSVESLRAVPDWVSCPVHRVGALVNEFWI